LQNESVNGHYKNIKFMCADVTSPDLKIKDGSIDLIFSNWLLMYLSDKEVKTVFHYLILVVSRMFRDESLNLVDGDGRWN